MPNGVWFPSEEGRPVRMSVIFVLFGPGGTCMHTFVVEISWRGSVVWESIRANTPTAAKSAVLAHYPGSTLRRIFRDG